MPYKKETSVWLSLAQPKWIFWSVRGFFFFSFVFFMLFAPEYDHRLWLLLLVLLVYSTIAYIFTQKVKGEKFYFLSCLLDIILVTIAMTLTDRKESPFFLLFFLIVPFGSYVVGVIPGLSLAFLASIFYLS